VPDSGVPAAIGYSQAAGIPYELGIIRNHYVGRTFIQPTQSIRELGVRMKHNANRSVVAGKRIVLIDDSLVRGTTSVKIVRMMREAGATEVHFRIASPPITHPDFYGIDTPERDKLMAATHTVEEMRKIIDADLARLPVGRRHLPRHGRRAPRPAAAAIHRPLLHRRVSDAAHRPQRRHDPAAAALAAGGGELSAGVLSGRIALVTGASRGIGAATARALARAGAHVVAVARTVGGLEELDDAIRAAGGSATLVPLDVTDFAGLARLAGALDERHRHLDILVGNAALGGPSSPLDHITLADWDEVMKVNVTANWQLICAMDALLRRSDAGRAVFLTSGAAHDMRAYRGLYSASKAALEAVVRTYAAETARTSVRVNLFNPGATRTRMRAQAMPGEDPMTLPPPEDVAEKIVALCMPEFSDTGRLYDFPTRTLMSFRQPE